MKYTAGETKTETEGVKQNETREERKTKTGKNQSMTVFASNIQPFN